MSKQHINPHDTEIGPDEFAFALGRTLYQQPQEIDIEAVRKALLKVTHDPDAGRNGQRSTGGTGLSFSQELDKRIRAARRARGGKKRRSK